MIMNEFWIRKKNEFQYKTATDIGILLLYCLCLWWWWWMLTNRIHHSTTHHWIIEKPNVNVCYTLRQKHKHNTQHMHCSAKLLNIRVNTLAIFFFLLAHAIHAVIHTTYTHTHSMNCFPLTSCLIIIKIVAVVVS